MIRTVDQLLEGLESLILAALDELCTLDSQGVAQSIALRELQRVVTTLEQHWNNTVTSIPQREHVWLTFARCTIESQRFRV
jgi:hypothetical protein